MKQSLPLTISLTLKSATLVGATLFAATAYASPSRGNDELYVASDDDISETIRNLSAQAQQKEERLAVLAQSRNAMPIIYRDTQPNYGSGYGLLAVRPISSAARNSSGFGYRTLFGTTRMHEGMDFAAPIGTPIYATGDGIVTHSGPGTGYGRYVEIDHGNGLVTRYGHTSRNFVNVGERVYANQHIADVGNVGRSTGPHLHYEVRKDGVPVNPNTYLALAPAR